MALGGLERIQGRDVVSTPRMAGSSQVLPEAASGRSPVIIREQS
jgi:hypothetical protein